MYTVETDSVNLESKSVTAVHVMAAELEFSTFRHKSLSDFNSVIWAVVLLGPHKLRGRSATQSLDRRN